MSSGVQGDRSAITENVGDGAVSVDFSVVQERVPTEGAVFDAAFGAEFGELLLVVLVGAASGLPVVDLVGDHLVVGK